MQAPRPPCHSAGAVRPRDVIIIGVAFTQCPTVQGPAAPYPIPVPPGPSLPPPTCRNPYAPAIQPSSHLTLKYHQVYFVHSRGKSISPSLSLPLVRVRMWAELAHGRQIRCRMPVVCTAHVLCGAAARAARATLHGRRQATAWLLPPALLLLTHPRTPTPSLQYPTCATTEPRRQGLRCVRSPPAPCRGAAAAAAAPAAAAVVVPAAAARPPAAPPAVP